MTTAVVGAASFCCVLLEIAEIGWAGAGGLFYPDKQYVLSAEKKKTETDATQREMFLVEFLSKFHKWGLF